ncbi:MAG TPA: VanZ family protein [Gammaproteobacteria bacterium]|nr:VanZ family protein [Gammaproteobacteria bacterium]
MPAIYRTAFWMPLVICTYLALMPGPYPDAIQLPDVVLHVLAFTYLMAALVLAHFDTDRNPLTLTFSILWIPATWMFFYSVALEVAQAFTPDRRAEILDLLWDTIGIGVGQVCYWGYVRIRPVQINRNRLNDG